LYDKYAAYRRKMGGLLDFNSISFAQIRLFSASQIWVTTYPPRTHHVATT
jgi:hypothetical protein